MSHSSLCTRVPRSLLIAAGVALALLASGCSTEPENTVPDDLSDFRERSGVAAAGTWSAQYVLDEDGTTESSAGSVRVDHTPDSLRLDITTDDGVATSITTPAGTVSCQVPASGEGGRCLQTAEGTATPPAALDPGLRTYFSTDLERLAEGFGVVEVVTGIDLPDDAVCASITGTDTAESLTCLREDGIVSLARFTSGSITLDETLAAPADDRFSPPLPITNP